MTLSVITIYRAATEMIPVQTPSIPPDAPKIASSTISSTI